MKQLFAMLAALGLTACASMVGSKGANVIVSGRVENLTYEAVNDPDDLLGHGWITANMKVERVHAGQLTERTITIRYLAHTYQYGGAMVRLKLRKGPDGGFVVCAKPGQTGLHCN